MLWSRHAKTKHHPQTLYPHLSQRHTRMNACYCRRQERDGQMNSPLPRREEKTKLDGGDEVAVEGDVAVRHARCIEGETGIALAVEKDEAASGVRAFGEKVNGFAGGDIGCRSIAGGGRRCIDAGRRLAKKIDGGFGHNDFHDSFAVAGAGDAASFGVGITAAADERRIADAAGKFATSPSRRCGGKEIARAVHGDGADGSLLVTTVIRGGVLVRFALAPGLALGFADQIFRLAELDAPLFGEAFGAFGDEHHVRAVFENFPGHLNGVLDALQARRSAGAKRRAVHDDGVTLDASVEIEMRAVAGVENGVVFEDHDGGFDGVQGGAAARENGPTRGESAVAAGFASFYGLVGDVPRAAMHYQRWFHRDEDGKGTSVCPGEVKVALLKKTESNTAYDSPQSAEEGKRLDKEIQNKKEQTDQEKNGAAVDAAARETAKGADERSRDGFEAGFLADAVERADGGIAGEVSSKEGDFVVNPNGKIVAVAPHEGGADRE